MNNLFLINERYTKGYIIYILDINLFFENLTLIMVALLFICLAIYIMLSYFNGICNRWTEEQRNQLKAEMESALKDTNKRKDMLYIKLAYQAASNKLLNKNTSYNSREWIAHGPQAALNGSNLYRIRRAVEFAKKNGDLDAKDLSTSYARVYVTATGKTVVASPEFIFLVSRHDPQNSSK